MGLYHLLIGSLMEPEDDFCQRLRKATSSFLFLPGSLVTLFYTVQIGLTELDENQATISRFLALMFMTLVFWAQYAYVRKVRHISALQAALVPWAFLVPNFVFVLNACEYDHKSAVVTIGILAVLLQIPYIAVFLLVCLVQAGLQDWNVAHLAHPNSLLILPGAILGLDTMMRFLFGFITSLLIGAALYNFIRQVRESERRGAAQKAANEMTLEILNCQRKYDTIQISRILEERENANVVDPELVQLYKKMNANLESYRPFLPNYLFQEEEEVPEAPDEAACPGLDDSHQSEQDVGGTWARRGINNNNVLEQNPDDQDRDDEDALSSLDLEEYSRCSSRLAESGRGSLTNTPVNLPGAEAVNFVMPRSIASAPLLPGLQLNRRGPLFNGNITFALVDICAARLSVPGATSTTVTEVVGGDSHAPPGMSVNSVEVLKAVAHMVHSLAKETKASVHSMLGDTVQLTWNATSNAALCETKGAVFLARLSTLFAATRLALSAAICSGKATVHNITADSQQALIIEAPWLPALEACFELAKRAVSPATTAHGGCVLMDDRTMKGSHLEVESCPVELVRYKDNERPSFAGHYEHYVQGQCDDPLTTTDLFSSSNSVMQVPTQNSSSFTLVHQLLGEFTRSGNDEWMYQLQGQRGEQPENRDSSEVAGDHCNDPTSILQMKAIHLVANRRYEEALKVVEQIEPVVRRQASEDNGGVAARRQNNKPSRTRTTVVLLEALRARIVKEE